MPRQKTDSSHLKHLFEHVNIRSTVPVYSQLENLVRFAVESETVKPGDQLPFVRVLSEWIDLNPNTVAKAYRDLNIMGIVYSSRGSGFYVNRGIQAKCRDKVNHEIISRAFEVCAEARAAGMKPSEIQSIAKKYYKVAGAPYGEVPKEVMALARKKKMRINDFGRLRVLSDLA